MTPASSAHLLPEPDGEEPLLHQREYVVRSYRAGPGRMRIRGMVHDQKPPGMIIEGDPDPLSVHRMVVDLLVDYPSLQIAAAEVVMEVTPHEGCTSIEPAYAQLVGVSVTRGFSRKVQELFGGPRGCTHVGALLQAMAPVAIQSRWSMRALEGVPVEVGKTATEQRLEAMTFNFNTCHVWDAEGDLAQRVQGGEEPDPPRWAVERLATLGRTVAWWREQRR